MTDAGDIPKHYFAGGEINLPSVMPWVNSRFMSRRDRDKPDLLARCRLIIETGYAATEMLFDTGFNHQDTVLNSTARAHAAILDRE